MREQDPNKRAQVPAQDITKFSPQRGPFAGRAAALARLDNKTVPGAPPAAGITDPPLGVAAITDPPKRQMFAGRAAALSRLENEGPSGVVDVAAPSVSVPAENGIVGGPGWQSDDKGGFIGVGANRGQRWQSDGEGGFTGAGGLRGKNLESDGSGGFVGTGGLRGYTSPGATPLAEPPSRQMFAGRAAALDRLNTKGAPATGASNPLTDLPGSGDQESTSGVSFAAKPAAMFPNQPRMEIAHQDITSMPKNAASGAPSRATQMFGSYSRNLSGPSYMDNAGGLLEMADQRERNRVAELGRRDAQIDANITRANNAGARDRLQSMLNRIKEPTARDLKFKSGVAALNARVDAEQAIAQLGAPVTPAATSTASDLAAQDARTAHERAIGNLANVRASTEQQAVEAEIGRQRAQDQTIAQYDAAAPAQREALIDKVLLLAGKDPRRTGAASETFGNAVDELDADGNAIRTQYGDKGTRRVVQGARPMPKGKGVTVGPDGTLIYSDGGTPKLTEQQSKDLNYYRRGLAALKNMGGSEALADPMSKAGASVPLVGNALSGEEYQQAEQAGREFLASILRKDTGAAITNKELEYYGKTYLPQPFDSAQVLKQKAAARQTALAAIYSGMGPAQSLVNDDDASSLDAAPESVRNPDAEALAEAITAEGLERTRRRKRAVFDAASTQLDSSGSPEPIDYSALWK